MSDSLDAAAIRPQLRGHFGAEYRYHVTCESTQRLLAPADPEGAVAVSDEQTAGRGRLGRHWHAPAGTSVLASVLLRPQVDPARLPELSLVAGQAVAEGLAETTGLAPTVKFPNDVLVGGRKIAGILAEAQAGVVVLGIGVNVNQTAGELPRNAAIPATSVRLALGKPQPRGPVLAAILLALELRYLEWTSGALTFPAAS